jgi:small subunit ribosomal protein S19e
LTNVKDVNPHTLINLVAKDLKENKGVKMPEFAVFVKTGSHRERAPDNPDWWFMRMASILRKVYITGNVDVNSLRNYYGGRKNKGVRPEKFRKAGGKIIRVCLQDLEKLGFVKISDNKKGRILTSKGQKYLDKLASSLLKDLKKDVKNIEKKPKSEEKNIIENKE